MFWFVLLYLPFVKKATLFRGAPGRSRPLFSELNGGALMLVDFWAEWCGPCRMLGPVIEGLADEYEGRAVIGKVNVDEEGELAMRYGVMNIPTVILFKNGREIDRKVGVMPGAVFTQALDENL